jgi:hypothetical protein
MARPQRNNVDYFPFICKEGRAMFYIEQKYGNDGFATWIKILRQLAVTDYHYLNLSEDVDSMFLAAKCKVSDEVLKSIINDLVKLGEFDSFLWEKCRVIWSQKFIENIEDAYSKRSNNIMNYDGLKEHLTGLGVLKPSKSKSKGVVKPQSIVEYTKEEESKEDKIKELFERFWNLYDKKTSRDKCYKKFKALKPEEMEKLFQHVPKYVEATPEKQYRKNPETYLNNKSFNDEIIDRNQKDKTEIDELLNPKVW